LATASKHAWVRPVVDYGPLIVFMAAYFLALGFAMERRIAPLPLLAGVFALIFGGLTLIFNDDRFVKMKPTVINVALGMAMLIGVAMRKNPLKVLLGSALHLPDPAWRTLTIRYGIFFLFQAVLNEVVWRTQPNDVWVLFRFPGLQILALAFSFSQLPLMMKGMKQMEAKDADVAAKPD
jgi:intracellular septation protein